MIPFPPVPRPVATTSGTESRVAAGRGQAGRLCPTLRRGVGQRETAGRPVLRRPFPPWRFLAVALLAVGLLTDGASGQDVPARTGDPLAAFARQVLDANREVAAAREDLEAARHQFRKVPTRFQPTLTVGETSAKSANRNYHDATGLDEDYTTRQRGTTVGVRQETPIGTGRFEVTRTLTEYTQAQTSHFQSAYLSLERGLLKRPDRRITLDRRIGRQEYQVTRTRISGQVQQTLLEAFRALFQRLIAAEEFRFRERSLAFYASLVEEAEVKLQSGLGSELDLKQARMRRTQAETGLEQSRLDLDEADRRVGLVLGNPDWDPALASFTPAAVAAQVPADLDPKVVLREGLPTRLDLRQADAQLSLARDTVRLAREQSRPDLDLAVRWGRQGRATLAEMARDMRDRNWDVSLTWSQPLGPDPEVLDRRSEERRLAATSLRRTQAEEAGRQAILEAVARIGFHRQRVRDLAAAASLSAEVLEGQRLNFQLGKTSLLDLSRYQSDHEEACLAVVRAEAELVLGWLALLSETGMLAARFADDGAAWPPPWLPPSAPLPPAMAGGIPDPGSGTRPTAAGRPEGLSEAGHVHEPSMKSHRPSSADREARKEPGPASSTARDSLSEADPDGTGAGDQHPAFAGTGTASMPAAPARPLLPAAPPPTAHDHANP